MSPSRKLGVTLLACIGSLASQGAQASNAAPPADESDAKVPACLSVRTQARYVMGYDHIVHLTNDCDYALDCSVATDVNPEAQDVQVPSKEERTVLTYRGSPARVFQARVRCEK